MSKNRTRIYLLIVLLAFSAVILLIIIKLPQNYAKDEIINTIERAPINDLINIKKVSYKNDGQIITVNSIIIDNLKFRIPIRYNNMENCYKIHTKKLWGKYFKINKNRPYVPQNIDIEVDANTDNDIKIYCGSDIFYPKESQSTKLNNKYIFENIEFGHGITRYLEFGNNGYSSFLKKRDETNDNLINDGIGPILILCAVEIDNYGKIKSRSRFILVCRKGIRNPNDIWFSKYSKEAFLSQDKKYIAFQSPEPGGNSFDVFYSSIDGSNIINITKNENIYDGIISNTGRIEWIDSNSLQYESAREGRKRRCVYNIKILKD